MRATNATHGRSRVPSRLLRVAALALALVVSAPPTTAAAQSGEVCGTLRAFVWPNALNGTNGLATVADQTYELSFHTWSSGASTISRSIAVGRPACLSGELQDTTSLLSTFTLAPCAACREESLLPAVDGVPTWLLWLVVLVGLGSLASIAAGRGRRPTRPPLVGAGGAIRVGHGARTLGTTASRTDPREDLAARAVAWRTRRHVS